MYVEDVCSLRFQYNWVNFKEFVISAFTVSHGCNELVFRLFG